ncbi:MAG TPA: hypothetical protein VFO41_04075 [Alphaproteobacteria bacterium]|nr:hypothetical protein [Alphaproteobacteria bacterium]
MALTMGVERGAVAGAVSRYLNPDGTVRSYARLAVPRPSRNATIEELQAPKVHKWRDEVPAGTPSPAAAKPKKTIQWSVLQNGFTRNADPARALKADVVQRPSEARISLPRVSIQARDDFSDADVRAGSADRAWTEREMAE